MDFDYLTVTLGRPAMRAASEDIDYYLLAHGPGETAASCEVPSEPVQEREGKAPVQAVRFPDTHPAADTLPV